MYKFFMVYKYLLNRPINLLGMIGVLIATWALIFVPSIFSGYIVKIEHHVRSTVADLSLILRGGSRPLSFSKVAKQLQEDKDVESLSPRLSWYGMLIPAKENAETVSASDQDFFQLIGIDDELEKGRFASWLRAVKDPQLQAPLSKPFEHKENAPPKILLGVDKAKELGLKRGDTLVLTTGFRDDSEADENVQSIVIEFELGGCFSSEHFAFDEYSAFVSIQDLRNILRGSAPPGLDRFNEIDIHARKGADLDLLSDRLNALLRDRNIPGIVVTWKKRQERFLESVEHQRFLLQLVLAALMVVAGFLIFATLSMMVSEKTKDIGILSALGATRKGLLSIFLFSGLSVAITGFFLGLLGAWISCKNLNAVNDFLADRFSLNLFPKDVYGLKVIPYAIDPLWVAQVGLGAMVLAGLFSLFPAWRAARLDPIQSMRSE
ncbi:MAG TPA: ABC transporter permease [Planctomycetes bacterium]|nr:ABC transporter permease [Planctomycetota bacterium]